MAILICRPDTKQNNFSLFVCCLRSSFPPLVSCLGISCSLYFCSLFGALLFFFLYVWFWWTGMLHYSVVFHLFVFFWLQKSAFPSLSFYFFLLPLLNKTLCFHFSKVKRAKKQFSGTVRIQMELVKGRWKVYERMRWYLFLFLLACFSMIDRHLKAYCLWIHSFWYLVEMSGAIPNSLDTWPLFAIFCERTLWKLLKSVASFHWLSG